MNKIPRHQISTMIARRSLQAATPTPLAKEIAAYLLVNRRTAELESLLRDIMQYRADQGIVEVFATSAHPLGSEVRQDVKARIRAMYPAAKRVIISENLDQNLIGSIRLELANQQFDASIRSKLNHFKQLTAAGKD